MQQQMISPDIRRRLQQHLSPGEELLWAGVPRQGLVLKPSDAVAIPFSLLWGGFAIFWEVAVWLDGAAGLFKLWGMPLVLIGLYLMAGRFFYDAWARRHIVYAVTSQRILILRGDKSYLLGVESWVERLDLVTLPKMTLHEKGDGSGTIVFGPLWTRAGSSPGFELSEQARAVYEVIRTAQQRARGGGA